MEGLSPPRRGDEEASTAPPTIEQDIPSAAPLNVGRMFHFAQRQALQEIDEDPLLKDAFERLQHTLDSSDKHITISATEMVQPLAGQDDHIVVFNITTRQRDSDAYQSSPTDDKLLHM